MTELQAYACRLRHLANGAVVLSTSRGKAKAAYVRAIPDYYRFVDVRTKRVPLSLSTPEFQRVAESRGLPHARLGDRVRANGKLGYIVGSDSSARFVVLFDDGARCPCHPRWRFEFVDIEGVSSLECPCCGRKSAHGLVLCVSCFRQWPCDCGRDDRRAAYMYTDGDPATCGCPCWVSCDGEEPAHLAWDDEELCPTCSTDEEILAHGAHCLDEQDSDEVVDTAETTPWPDQAEPDA